MLGIGTIMTVTMAGGYSLYTMSQRVETVRQFSEEKRVAEAPQKVEEKQRAEAPATDRVASTTYSGPQIQHDIPACSVSAITGILDSVYSNRILIKDQNKKCFFSTDGGTEVFIDTLRQSGLDAIRPLIGSMVTAQTNLPLYSNIPGNATRVYGSTFPSGTPRR
jgi:hypothetical protein